MAPVEIQGGTFSQIRKRGKVIIPESETLRMCPGAYGLLHSADTFAF
jgi:hypothetical protein